MKVYPITFKQFTPRYDFTKDENEFLKGSYYICWNVPGPEYNKDEDVKLHGNCYSGWSNYKQRDVIRHFVSYPIRNKELFKNSSDVYDHLDRSFIKVDWIEPVSDWYDATTVWHNE